MGLSSSRMRLHARQHPCRWRQSGERAMDLRSLDSHLHQLDQFQLDQLQALLMAATQGRQVCRIWVMGTGTGEVGFEKEGCPNRRAVLEYVCAAVVVRVRACVGGAKRDSWRHAWRHACARFGFDGGRGLDLVQDLRVSESDAKMTQRDERSDNDVSRSRQTRLPPATGSCNDPQHSWASIQFEHLVLLSTMFTHHTAAIITPLPAVEAALYSRQARGHYAWLCARLHLSVSPHSNLDTLQQGCRRQHPFAASCLDGLAGGIEPKNWKPKKKSVCLGTRVAVLAQVF